jgi:hypothetical protein
VLALVPRGRHQSRARKAAAIGWIQCKNWALRKTDGSYFPTCRYHGSHLPRGKQERKKIYGRVLSPNQWKRYERQWTQRAADYDASRVAGAPPKKLPPAVLSNGHRDGHIEQIWQIL